MVYAKISKTVITVCCLIFSLVSIPIVSLASGGFSPSMGAKKSEGFNRGKAILYGKAGIPGCGSCHKKWKRGDVKKFLPRLEGLLSAGGGHKPSLRHNYTADEISAIQEYLKTRYRVR